MAPSLQAHVILRISDTGTRRKRPEQELSTRLQGSPLGSTKSTVCWITSKLEILNSTKIASAPAYLNSACRFWAARSEVTEVVSTVLEGRCLPLFSFSDAEEREALPVKTLPMLPVCFERLLG